MCPTPLQSWNRWNKLRKSDNKNWYNPVWCLHTTQDGIWTNEGAAMVSHYNFAIESYFLENWALFRINGSFFLVTIRSSPSPNGKLHHALFFWTEKNLSWKSYWVICSISNTMDPNLFYPDCIILPPTHFWAPIGFSLGAPSNEYLGSVFAITVQWCAIEFLRL